MELLTFSVPKSAKTLTITTLNDIQWTGQAGTTAKEYLRRHIDEALQRDAYFIGLGDMIDLMSPSNRKRIAGSGLYDTAMEVLWTKSKELCDELYEEFLKPTTGRWLSFVEGHHFYEHAGETSDEYLCTLLKAPFVGTSAFVHNAKHDFTLYTHHGMGGGMLPGSALNKPYHTATGLQGADVYLFAHSTKLAAARLSRPFPKWGQLRKDHALEAKNVWLVSCGGFSRSNVVGHRVNGIVRGDYAEQGLMTPSPLATPFIKVDLSREREYRTRVEL